MTSRNCLAEHHVGDWNFVECIFINFKEGKQIRPNEPKKKKKQTNIDKTTKSEVVMLLHGEIYYLAVWGGCHEQVKCHKHAGTCAASWKLIAAWLCLACGPSLDFMRTWESGHYYKSRFMRGSKDNSNINNSLVIVSSTVTPNMIIWKKASVYIICHSVIIGHLPKDGFFFLVHFKELITIWFIIFLNIFSVLSFFFFRKNLNPVELYWLENMN